MPGGAGEMGGASPNLIPEAEGAGGGGDRRCEVWLKISEARCQSETSETV